MLVHLLSRLQIFPVRCKQGHFVLVLRDILHLRVHVVRVAVGAVEELYALGDVQGNFFSVLAQIVAGADTGLAVAAVVGDVKSVKYHLGKGVVGA